MRQSETIEWRRVYANDPYAHDWNGLCQLSAAACIRTLTAEGSAWVPAQQPAKNGLCVRR